MFKSIFRIIAVFAIGMIGGIFANQIFWPYFVERPLFYKYRLEKAPVYLTEEKEIIIQENTALKEAAEKVKKVVVGVRTKTKTGKFLEGSGLIVTTDGLMVTLASLAPQGASFSFFLDGNSVSAQVLKRDLKENLALVKISDSILTTASFAKLDKLKMGERVFLVGVFFENKIPSKSANEGIVKSFNEDLIRTNIIESNLMAGSPLFNIEGEVLGMSMIDSEGKVSAIPVAKIKNFIGL